MVGDELQKTGGRQYLFTANEAGLYKHSPKRSYIYICLLHLWFVNAYFPSGKLSRLLLLDTEILQDWVQPASTSSDLYQYHVLVLQKYPFHIHMAGSQELTTIIGGVCRAGQCAFFNKGCGSDSDELL
jgi:hypothetical protein